MQYEKEKLLSIAKPAAVCALCGESLTSEPKHPSVLRKAEDAPEQPKAAGKKDEGKATPADNGETPPGSGASEEDKPEFIRSDYHRACWRKVRKSDYLSFWLAKRPEPPATRAMSKQERNTALLGLFSAVMTTNDPVDEPIKFVLSHLLMKYRVLTLAGSHVDENGRKWIQFEIPKTEERFEIPDIRLSDEHLVETKARIDEFLAKAQTRVEREPPAVEED